MSAFLIYGCYPAIALPSLRVMTTVAERGRAVLLFMSVCVQANGCLAHQNSFNLHLGAQR